MNNNVKDKIFNGEPVLGCFMGFYAPAIVEMMGYAGFDFIVIDNEHGWFNPAEMENMIRAAEVSGIAPIVRVDYDNSSIQKVLDRGALGIQVPMVNNKEDAERVVRRAKFPPTGQRGTAYSTRAARYGKDGGKTYLDSADDNILIAVHIETPEAVKNFEEIMSVQGIDVAFIGPLDLAINMGYKDEGPKHPEVQRVINNLYERAHKKGIKIGTLASTQSAIPQVLNKGANYVVTVITALLTEAFKMNVDAIKDINKLSRGENTSQDD